MSHHDERSGFSREDLQRWSDEMDRLFRLRLPRGRIIVASLPKVPADWFRLVPKETPDAP